MATFKLDIVKQYGQLLHRLYPSTDKAPDYAVPVKDVNALIEAVAKTLDGAKVAKADTVIFRQIGYEDRQELREAVRTATY